jgi:hypothetical protein
MQTDCVLCQVRAEVEETVDGLKATQPYVFSVIYERKSEKELV